jgi:hypothetical protein
VNDLAAVYAKNRTSAREFVASRPIGLVTIMRFCLAPQLTIMHKYLIISSKGASTDSEADACQGKLTQILEVLGASLAERHAGMTHDRLFEVFRFGIHLFTVCISNIRKGVCAYRQTANEPLLLVEHSSREGGAESAMTCTRAEGIFSKVDANLFD